MSLPETSLQVKTDLLFNPRARQWEVHNGTVTRFPAGPAGKRAGQLYALEHDVPDVAADVAALIARYADQPQAQAIASRAVKAGFLVRDGHITALEVGRNGHPKFIRASVKSQRGEWRYLVLHNLTWSCECEDWDNGDALRLGLPRRAGAPHIKGKGVACKHVLAVSLKLSQLRREADRQREQASHFAEVVEGLVNEEIWGSSHY